MLVMKNTPLLFAAGYAGLSREARRRPVSEFHGPQLMRAA
jgi:hypothetical protein